MAKKHARFVTSRFVFPVLILLLILSLTGNGYGLYRIWQGNRVTAVPDGDSIDLSSGRRIRLLALDAPERGRCMAEEAKAGLTDLVLGRHVRLKNTVKDNFGRTLAIVVIEDPSVWLSSLVKRFHLSDLNICSPRWSFGEAGRICRIDNVDPLVNRVMVSRGWARLESAPEPYADSLKSASQTAKDGKLGIWSETCRSSQPVVQACTIKGNVRDGKKTYHYPGCDNYDQVIVDLSYGDAWFCTQKEAQALGFSKAAGCR